MASNSAAAARLRRKLHDEVARADVSAMRETLHSLYEDDESPLGGRHDIANPSAFAALVETTCLAQVHAHLHNSDRVRGHIASEMEENVERLRKGFGVDADTIARVREALDLCETSSSVEDAHRKTERALKGTQLYGRVKVMRHSVSHTPKGRASRPRSPPPRRVDDVDNNVKEQGEDEGRSG